jgi:hypothetical protein
MERVLVGVGIDRDRLDAHAARGLDDPAGDFAAIGDQDALEHTPVGPSVPAPLALRRCGENVNRPRQTITIVMSTEKALRPMTR